MSFSKVAILVFRFAGSGRGKPQLSPPPVSIDGEHPQLYECKFVYEYGRSLYEYVEVEKVDRPIGQGTMYITGLTHPYIDNNKVTFKIETLGVILFCCATFELHNWLSNITYKRT